MKALTIFQPWASLIVAGAKPFEFRKWRAPPWLIGQDMVVHASAKLIDPEEIEDLLERLDGDEAWTTALNRELALPILERAMRQATWRPTKPPKARKVTPDLFGEPPAPIAPLSELLPPFDPLPVSAGLCIVRVGTPVNGQQAAAKFGHTINDSDRKAHSNWGWPMEDVRPFPEPVPMRGFQGLWDWPDATKFAAAL